MTKLLLFFSLLFSSGAHANAVMFGSPSYVTVTSSSSVVLAQNTLRGYLLVINRGSGTIYLKAGAPATTNDVIIPAGGNYEPLKAPANSIYLISPSGSFATVLEGTGE